MQKGKRMKFVGDSRVSAEKKPNTPKDYSEYPGKTEAFWPNFLLKEWMVGAVFLVGFLCLVIAHPSPLEGIADPTNAAYIPLPDWYFLFLYQLLKYTYASGPYTLIGVLGIPGLAFGALLLAPFLDRGVERRPSKRPIATGLMLMAIASIFYLTWESVATHDWEAAKKQGEIQQFIEVDKTDPAYEIATVNTCITCHGDNFEGGTAAPSLQGLNLTAEEIEQIAREGTGVMPAGVFKGTDEELDTLSLYLEKISGE